MDEVSPYHELDQRLVGAILEFAESRFPDALLEEVDYLDSHPDMSAQFAGPWLAYVAPFDGRPAVDRYLEERGWSLSRGVCDWIEAQRKAWLSVWEVVDVEPGRSIDLRDLLTNETRTVHEVSGSKVARRHYLVLARVVDAGSVSLICGMHGVPLRPNDGADVVETIRRALRRKTAVAPERLRDPKITNRMLNAWSDAIDRWRIPPRLQNSDADPVLLTTDCWKFASAQRDEIVARIASLDGAQTTDDGFVFLREDDTVVGFLRIGDGVVVADTNSIARADALRQRIEAACDGLIGQAVRSHSDPLAGIDRESLEREPDQAGTPEEQAIVRDFKEQYYERWLDEPVPALDGKTPRKAVRTKSGRARVDVILKDIEIAESSLPEAERFDVRKLRDTLGLS